MPALPLLLQLLPPHQRLLLLLPKKSLLPRPELHHHLRVHLHPQDLLLHLLHLPHSVQPRLGLVPVKEEEEEEEEEEEGEVLAEMIWQRLWQGPGCVKRPR